MKQTVCMEIILEYYAYIYYDDVKSISQSSRPCNDVVVFLPFFPFFFFFVSVFQISCLSFFLVIKYRQFFIYFVFLFNFIRFEFCVVFFMFFIFLSSLSHTHTGTSLCRFSTVLLFSMPVLSCLPLSSSWVLLFSCCQSFPLAVVVFIFVVFLTNVL